MIPGVKRDIQAAQVAYADRAADYEELARVVPSRNAAVAWGLDFLEQSAFTLKSEAIWLGAGLAGGVAGAIKGGMMSGPFWPIGVAAGAIAGASLATAGASAYNSWSEARIEGGAAGAAALKSLTDAGMSFEEALPHAAAAYRKAYGANMLTLPANAILDQLLIGGVGGRALKTAGRRIFRAVLKATGKRRLARFAAVTAAKGVPFALNVAGEGVEEGQQSLIFDWAQGHPLDFGAAREQAIGGMVQGGVHALLGLGMGRVLETVKGRTGKKLNAWAKDIDTAVKLMDDIASGRVGEDDVVGTATYLFVDKKALDAAAGEGVLDGYAFHEPEADGTDRAEYAVSKAEFERFKVENPAAFEAVRNDVREGTRGVTARERVIEAAMAADRISRSPLGADDPEAARARWHVANFIAGFREQAAGAGRKFSDEYIDAAGALYGNMLLASARMTGQRVDDVMRVFVRRRGAQSGAADLAAAQDGAERHGQPLNADVDLEQRVPVFDATTVSLGVNTTDKGALLQHLKGLIGQEFSTLNNDALVKIVGTVGSEKNRQDFVRHLVYSGEGRHSRQPRQRGAALLSLENLISNAVLIESIPNTERSNPKKRNVEMYHRLYVPMRIGNDVYTLRLVVDEESGKLNMNPLETRLFDARIDKTISSSKTALEPVSRGSVVGRGDHEISIRDMLAGVKDADGADYVYGQSKANEVLRGSIDFFRGQNEAIINLFDAANETTIFHELWHFGLDNLIMLGDSPTASAETADYRDEVLRFLEIDDIDFSVPYNQMDAGTRARIDRAHEQWAKGGERYLETGRAPIPEMQGLFDRIRNWILGLIDGMRDEIELSPEVMKLYDRMLAVPTELDEQFRENTTVEGLWQETERLGGAVRRDGARDEQKAQTSATGLEAMDRVIAEHTDAVDAMHRDDLGGISFLWGEPGKGPKLKGGWGVSHLIARRNSEGLDGEAIARKMVEVIEKGEISQQYNIGTPGQERADIVFDGYEAHLALYKDGKRQTWLLTGYKKSPGASGEASGSTGATLSVPTPRGREEGAGDVENSIAPETDDVESHNQSAYHGSPHRFDRFSTEHVGSGEGAQAYGWGLYFAGKRAVAEYYRETLTECFLVNGKKVYEDKGSDAYSMYKFAAEGRLQEYIDDATAIANEYAAKSTEKDDWHDKLYKKYSRHAKEAKKLIGKNVKRDEGQLYHVDVPEDDTLLDYDRPMSEQPEAVRRALGEIAAALTPEQLADLDGDISLLVGDDVTGELFYNTLSAMSGIGGDQGASLLLAEHGVPGLRYLDGNSRSGGEGSHNYVIFDDAAVDVMETFYQTAGAEAALAADEAAWGKAVDGAHTKPAGTMLQVMTTPLVMHMAGTDVKPVFMRAEKIGEILKDHPGITKEILKQVPRALTNPIAIFESASSAQAGKNGLVVMLELLDNDNASIMAAFHLDVTRNGYSINRLASVYGKDRDQWFVKQAQSGRLRYVNVKKANAWSGQTGLPLLSVGSDKHQLHADNIKTEDDLVNLRNEYRTLYQTVETDGFDPAEPGTESGGLTVELLSNPLNTDELIDAYGEQFMEGLPQGIDAPDGTLSLDEAAELFGFESPDDLIAALVAEAAETERAAWDELEAQAEAEAAAEDDPGSRANVIKWIREHGGINYGSVYAVFGKESADILRKRVGPGLFKKGGLNLDKIVQELAELGAKLQSDGDLYDLLASAADEGLSAIEQAVAEGVKRGRAETFAEARQAERAQLDEAKAAGRREALAQTAEAIREHKAHIADLAGMLERKEITLKEYRRLYDKLRRDAGKFLNKHYDRIDALTQKSRIAVERERVKAAVAAEDARANLKAQREKGNHLLRKYRALQAEKAKVGRMIKAIGKAAVSGGVFAPYRDEIAALVAAYDLKRRSAATMERRADFAKMFEADPAFAAELLPDEMEYLGRTSLNEMSIYDVEQLHDEAMALAEIGRREWQAIRAAKAERTGAMHAEMEAVLLAQRKAGRVGAVRNKGDVGKDYSGILGGILRAKDEFFARTLNIQRLADLLDGMFGRFDGPFVRYIADAANAAKNGELRHVARRLEAFDAFCESIGYDKRRLGDPIDAGGVVGRDGTPLTRSEALSVYMATLNEKANAAIAANFEAYENPRAAIGQVIGALSDADRQVAAFLFRDWDAEHARIADVMSRTYNISMGKEENYMPLLRLQRAGMSSAEADAAARSAVLGGPVGRGRGGVERGFTVARVEMDESAQGAIRLGAVENWIDQVRVQEHAVAFGPLLADLNSALYRRPDRKKIEAGAAEKFQTIPNLIKETFGSATWEAVQTYLGVVAADDAAVANALMDGLARTAVKNASVTYLAYSMSTALKQVTSLPRFFRSASPMQLTAAVAKYVFNHGETVRRIDALDPQMKERKLDPLIAAMRAQQRRAAVSKFGRAAEKVVDFGFTMLQEMDRMIAYVGWDAVFHDQVGGGASIETAAREATREVLLTQQAASAMNQPAWWNQRGLLRLINIFTSDTAQTLGMTVYDGPAFLRGGQGMKFLRNTAGLALCALLTQLVTEGGPDGEEDDEAWYEWAAQAFTRQNIGMIPLVGKDIANVIDAKVFGERVFSGDNVMAAPFAKALGGGIALAKGLSEEEFDENGFWSLVDGFALLTGKIPATAVRRLYKAYKDMREGEFKRAVARMFAIRLEEREMRRRAYGF